MAACRFRVALDAPSPESYVVAFRRITTNGVSLRVAVEGTGPLCILVHGWPELWLSWRHQIAPLVAAGYQVAVPDIRGYGGSDAPDEVSAYGMEALTADIVGIMDALGHKTAILIGHDWGAPIVWHTALLHPQRVSAVVGMSVPYTGVLGVAPTQLLKLAYPDRFFYMLYFQTLKRPEAEFEADVRDSLLKIYFANSADSTKAVRAAMRARTAASGYLDGLPRPDVLPAWLPEKDLDEYVAAYQQSGFHGGIHRYRNIDEDWRRLRHLAGKTIQQPALFLAGEYDSVLRYAPGVNMLDIMAPFYDDLRGKIVIPGAGHWVQQEQPQAVNQHLLDFLHGLDGAPRPRS